MKTFGHVFSLAVGSLLLACVLPFDSSLAASDCPAGSEVISKVELYFGLDIPGGGRVKPSAWQTFVEEKVTPKFPNGLTIYKALGQWQDEQTGETIQEPSRVLVILYEPSAEAERNIQEIRTAYKEQFHQDSVIRLNEMACVSF